MPGREKSRFSSRIRSVNCHIKCDWQWFWPNYVRLVSHNICDWAKRFRKPAYWYPLQVGYDRPVGEAVYAIENRMDRRCWLQHERSKRSPNGCLHGTAARRRNESAECEIALLSNKENRKNRRGPIALHLDCFSMATAAACLMNLAASRHWLCFDTSSCRILPLADLANAIPRSSYLFGASWPDVRRTLLVAVEQDSRK